MEVCADSASDVILMGWNHYKSLCHTLGHEFELKTITNKVSAANGTPMNVAGKTKMLVASKHASARYNVYICKEAMKGPPLLSETALLALGYLVVDPEGKFASQEASVKKVNLQDSCLDPHFQVKISNINKKYKVVFKGLGRLKNFKAKFSIKKHAQPFVKPCLPIPLHLKEAVLETIKYFIECGVLEYLPPNTPARYVCSLIVVPKTGGKVRICANLKPLNEIIERSRFVPAPRLEEFQDKLRGCTIFGSVDIKEAYHQIAIDEETANLCVISTPFGMLRYRCLPMGCSVSGDILDERMAVVLKDCHNSINLRDDIIFGSTTQEGLVQEYEKIISALAENGLTLNEDKVCLGLQSINFYGMEFSAKGMSPSKEKIKDLQKATMPPHQKGVTSFVCLMEWQQRYILRFAEEAQVLRELAATKGPMMCEPKHLEAFERLKNALTEDTLLAYFNPDHKTYLFCDAGKTAHQPGDRGGLCCVLSQVDPSKPKEFIAIHFASRVMSDTESRYSQTEVECLAIVWGVLKFSYYLEGMRKPFVVFTDAKSLIPMFEKLSPTCPSRIFRLFLKLQHLPMKLQYREGRVNPSDFLSRAAQPSNEDEKSMRETEDMEVELVKNIQLASDKMCLALVREATLEDEELQSVTKRIQDNDWDLHKKDPLIKPYYSLRHEFYVVDNVIFRNGTIVIPTALRSKVTKLIHRIGHLGMTNTKRLLQEYFWFPNFSSYCMAEVQKCSPCQFTTRPKDKEQSGYFLPEPIVFHSVAVDYKGPIKADHYYILALVCLYSGWAEVMYVTSTSFQALQPKLLDYMSRHGKMKNIISDNGPPFSSHDFEKFCDSHNISRKPVIEVHPSANGNVESFNRSLEKAIHRSQILNTNYRTEIANMLMAKMSCPHPGTLKTPHELVFNKKASLNILPDYEFTQTNVNHKEAHQNLIDYKNATKAKHDKKNNVQNRLFHLNDLVLCCLDLGLKKKKFSSDLYKVIDVKPSYLVVSRLKDGQVLRRHKDHFKIYIPPEELNNQPNKSKLLTPHNISNEGKEKRQSHSQLLTPHHISNEGEEKEQWDDGDFTPLNVPLNLDNAEFPPLQAPLNRPQEVPLNRERAEGPPNLVHQPQPERRRVHFRNFVDIQEIPPQGHGKALRSKGPVEDHPHVQPSVLERSQDQQRLARERIAQQENWEGGTFES